MRFVVLDEELPLEKIQFLQGKYRVVSSPYNEKLVFSSLHFLIKSTEHSDFSDKERSTLSKFVKVGKVL